MLLRNKSDIYGDDNIVFICLIFFSYMNKKKIFFDNLETFVCNLYNNYNKQATLFIIARLATQPLFVFVNWYQFLEKLSLTK